MSLNETNDNSFEKDTQNGIVLVDFYATWCGPCKMIAPLLEEMSKEFSNIKFFKANVDDSPQIAQSLGISGVPTLMIFKDGKQVDTKVGALDRNGLRAFLQPHS